MSSLLRIVKYGFQNFWRNKALSFVAVTIMTFTLLTITMFVILNLLVIFNINKVKDRIDLTVYFKDDVTDQAIFDLQKNLANLPAVKEVTYVSKEDALKRWQQQFNDNDSLKGIVSQAYNPLPRSLEVSPQDPSQLPQIENIIHQDVYALMIADTSYTRNKDIVNRLLSLLQFIKRSGLAIGLFFILISFLVIFNTIRLTIFTKRDEIEVMKLVGAAKGFIRGPFVVEGVLYGLFGSIFSLLIIYFGVYFLSPYVSPYFGLETDLFSYLVKYIPVIVAFQFGVATIIGTICSQFAMWRHLRIWSR